MEAGSDAARLVEAARTVELGLALIFEAKLVEALRMAELVFALTEAVPVMMFAARDEEEFRMLVLAVVTFVPTVASEAPSEGEALFVLPLIEVTAPETF